MNVELAKRTVAGLKEAGIDFVTYVPETRMSEILPLMKGEESIALVPVASEAEAVGIAAGAALLLLIAYVGSFEDRRNSFLFSHYGTKTTGILDTLGIQYQVIGSGDCLEARIKDATRMMHALKLPVALLFTGEFTE